MYNVLASSDSLHANKTEYGHFKSLKLWKYELAVVPNYEYYHSFYFPTH
jgi:hypothetical protein